MREIALRNASLSKCSYVGNSSVLVYMVLYVQAPCCSAEERIFRRQRYVLDPMPRRHSIISSSNRGYDTVAVYLSRISPIVSSCWEYCSALPLERQCRSSHCLAVLRSKRVAMEKATTRISPDVPQDIRRTQAVGCPKSASIFGRTQRPFATTTEAAPRNWAKLELGPSPSPLPPPTKDSSNKLKDTPVERSAAARYPVLKLKKVKPVSLHMCMIPIVIHPGSTSGKNPGQDASQGAFPRQNVPAAQARPNAKGNGERPTQHSPFIQHTAAPSTVRAASRTRQPAPSHDAQGSVCHPIVARNDHLWPVSPPETERKAPPGMVNLGNSCYQNSVIQMLMSSNQFLSLLEQYSCRGPLSTQLYQVTSQLQRIGVTPAVNAQALKNAMDRKTHHFRGTHQQDAHEFVVKMLELLEEEFKEEPPPQVTRNQRYPTDCFRMTVQVEKQCNSCRSKRYVCLHPTVVVIDCSSPFMHSCNRVTLTFLTTNFRFIRSVLPK